MRAFSSRGEPYSAPMTVDRHRPVRPLWVRCFAVAAGVLLVVGFALTVNAPAVTGHDGVSYSCSAPYDTVVHGDRNFPGVGPPPADAEAIATDCRDAGRTRYRQGIVLMGLGFLTGSAAGLAVLRVRIRARRRTVSA